MRQFSVTTDIPAPPDRVWEVMTDIERWHEWTPSITSIKRLDDGPLAVGSRVVNRQPRFQPALSKVTGIEQGAGFTWISVVPGLLVKGSHPVARTATGSRAVLSLEIEGVLGGLWGRITGGITERYLRLEAKGLKARSKNAQFVVDRQK